MFVRNKCVEALNYAVMKDVVENLSHYEVNCDYGNCLKKKNYVDTCVK